MYIHIYVLYIHIYVYIYMYIHIYIYMYTSSALWGLSSQLALSSQWCLLDIWLPTTAYSFDEPFFWTWARVQSTTHDIILIDWIDATIEREFYRFLMADCISQFTISAKQMQCNSRRWPSVWTRPLISRQTEIALVYPPGLVTNWKLKAPLLNVMTFNK